MDSVGRPGTLMTTIADALRRQAKVEKSLPLRRSPISIAVYREHLLDQFRTHEISYEIRTVMPSAVLAFANWSPRRVVIPPLDDEVHLAIGFHECGHILAGRCGGPLHRPDRSVRDWHHCTECELLACAFAVAMIEPLPLTKAMHGELSRGLRFHRANTPAPAAVYARLDRFISDVRFQELKLREAERGVQTSVLAVATCESWLKQIK